MMINKIKPLLKFKNGLWISGYYCDEPITGKTPKEAMKKLIKMQRDFLASSETPRDLSLLYKLRSLI